MGDTENGVACRVWDLNAHSGPRVHDVGGVAYTLHSRGDGTPVPLAHAVQFLKDPAFVVLDEKDQRMQMQGPAEKRVDMKLPPHQVIANLEELRVDSLVVRAKQFPGSESLTRNSGRAKLINFIMAGGVSDDIKSVTLDDQTANLIEEEDDPDGDTTVADKALEGEELAPI